MKLPDAEWRARAGLPELIDALDGAAGATRFVGGYVRDTLLGAAPADIDLATRLAPGTVIARIAAAGFKAVPTGLAHGTVTAILPSGPIEVTTLRRDVATDGRHAVVAFTDDWRADAARRDFTINALFADPRDGAVLDHFDGLADLHARRVRFIGDPLRRIAEDHLRILRFFRFHARFGRGAADEAALAACTTRANDLMALSRERIADELLKILALPDAAPVVATMCAHGILAPVLPEIADAAPLAALESRERMAGAAPDPLRRLAALLPADPAVADDVATRLRLSNRARKRLALAAARTGGTPGDPLALTYRLGKDAAADRILLSADLEPGPALAMIAAWTRPTLPVGGGDLIAQGLDAGPIVAQTLQAIERQWIAEGFPDTARARTLAADAVAQALRAAQ